jgi:hypothetical protein
LLGRPAIEVVRQPNHVAVAPAPPAPAKGSRLRLLGAAFLGLLLLLTGVVLGYLLRTGTAGFLLIELTPPLAGKAHLSINGKDYGTPDAWPHLQQITPGPIAVKVTAEGYKPFVQKVDVTEGKAPTSLQIQLTPAEEGAQLVVVTDPETAEVKVNGKVVKKEGAGGFHSVRVGLGTAQLVEASRAGFRTLGRNVVPQRSDEPLVLFLKLDPSEFSVLVSSDPSGAAIYAGDQWLGVTPQKIRITADITEITLRRKCYQPYPLTVKPPSEPNEVAKLGGDLTKLPGCR